MSRIQSKDFNAALLAPWEEKLWNSSDWSELTPFRDLLTGNAENLHSASSRIDVEESGVDDDSKRFEDEARGFL